VQPVKPRGGTAGWWLSLVLAAFIAGLYSAPHVRSGLVRAGIMEAVPDAYAAVGGPSDARVLEGLADRLTARQDRLSDAQSALGDQLADLQRRIAAGASAPSASSPDRDAAGVGGVAATVAADRLDAMSADLAALGRTVKNLSAAGLQAGDTQADISGLSQSLSAVRSELESLTARLGAYETVAKDLAAGAITASPRGRIMVTLASVRDALDTGAGFGTDADILLREVALLDAVTQAQLMGPLSRLADHSAGVATARDLSDGFADVAVALKRDHDAKSGGFLTGLFTVRRQGAGATGIDGVLNAAERAVAAGDYLAAADGLAAIDGSADSAAARWIADARGYMAAVRALEDIRARLLGGASSGAPIGAPADAFRGPSNPESGQSGAP